MVLSPEGVLQIPDVLNACRSGDADGFRNLFEAYKDRVYTIALRFSGDCGAAQDIAQDVFVKLYSSIAGFRGEPGAFDAWLYRLVVNRCLDQKRRSRRLMPLPDGVLELLHVPHESALDGVLRSETRGRLGAALARMPAGARILLVLRYSQGLSYAEIGQIYGCKEGTIASRLHRAHKDLERRLKCT